MLQVFLAVSLFISLSMPSFAESYHQCERYGVARSGEWRGHTFCIDITTSDLMPLAEKQVAGLLNGEWQGCLQEALRENRNLPDIFMAKILVFPRPDKDYPNIDVEWARGPKNLPKVLCFETFILNEFMGKEKIKYEFNIKYSFTVNSSEEDRKKCEKYKGNQSWELCYDDSDCVLVERYNSFRTSGKHSVDAINADHVSDLKEQTKCFEKMILDQAKPVNLNEYYKGAYCLRMRCPLDNSFLKRFFCPKGRCLKGESLKNDDWPKFSD